MLKPGLIAGAWEQRRRLLTAHGADCRMPFTLVGPGSPLRSVV